MGWRTGCDRFLQISGLAPPGPRSTAVPGVGRGGRAGIAAGNNWRNLKVVIPVVALCLANATFISNRTFRKFTAV